MENEIANLNEDAFLEGLWHLRKAGGQWISFDEYAQAVAVTLRHLEKSGAIRIISFSEQRP